jgi:hypothetical protein
MKNVSLFSFIKNSVEDDYAMNVFYNIVKSSFVDNGFSLKSVPSVYIDGRFFGEVTNISLRAKYNKTPNHVLALLLSIRLLIINPKLVKYCNDDKLIIASRIDESFQWIEFMACILDNWEDGDIKMLYSMLENYYFDEEFTEEEKEKFRDTIEIPEYRNEKAYYKGLARTTSGVANDVIGNNAFLEAEIRKYAVTKDIEFVGDTAFSYCKNLETLEFKGKTMFGTFPIVECNNLKQIIVPNGLLSYYRECLPYYKSLIIEKQDSGLISPKKEEPEHKKEPKQEFDDSQIEHIYVDVPSAEPYTEIEVPVEEEQTAVTEEEERKPIEVKKLQTVFDKVASSYKFFWMMAIISLAKEKHHLAISFDDITIRMASMAWPIVFEDDIDFGHNDIMKSYLEGVAKKTKLIKAATSNVVENHLKQHYSSQGVDKILSPLMKNVPYRFLSPWIKYTTDAEVIEKSCAKSFNGLYAIHSKYIVLDEEWWDYIYANYNDICDFAMRSFIEYSKKYNNDLKLLKLKTSGWPMIKK